MTTRARACFLVAAALTGLALALPLWTFRMSAPQYPDESLHLRVSRTGISGDVQEIETLQHYIGVRFPEALPELRWVTASMAALALLLGSAALSGRGRVGLAHRWTAVAALALFLAGSLAVLQIRLYEVGHARDPNAPLKSIKDFTPLALGPKKVGNFTVWSFPHAGGAALAVAFVFAAAGVRQGRAARHAQERIAA
jgi:hypothetical protein